MSRSLAITAAAAAVAALVPRVSRATSDAWTGAGGDALWSDALNWSTNPATVPGTGDTAVFNAAAGSGGSVIDLGAGVTVSTVLFTTSNAASYTLGAGAVGSQTLTLNNGGAVTINSTVLNNQLFNAAIVLGTDGSSQTFTFTNNSTTSSLTFAGNITGSTGPGTKTLVVTGAGAIGISGAISNEASGTVTLTKSGTGTLTLTGTNIYTGATTVIQGTLDIGGGTSSGSISSQSALSLGGGTLTLTNVAGVIQMFNGMTLTGGASLVKNTVSGDILALGSLTRTAGSGGTVDFTTTGTITTATTNDASDGGGILGGWATTGNSASSNSTGDWVANDGSGNIVPYTGYTLLATTANLSTTGAGASTQNWETGALNGANHVTTLTASATINSLVQQGDFGINSGATLTLASGGLILKGESRWILNNGAGSTAGTGKLTSGLPGGELFIHTPDGGADGTNWRIWTAIVDNGPTPVSLVKDGPGSVILENKNTYTGSTILQGGVLAISGAAGAAGTSSITINGGFLLPGANVYGGTTADGGNGTQQQNALGSGAITINGGALQLGYHATSTGSAYNVTNNITLNGGAIWANDAYQHLQGTLNVSSGGTLGSTYEGATNTWNKGLFIDGVVSGSGPLTLMQAGNGGEINGWGNGSGQTFNTSIVMFTNSANTYSGTITVTGGTTQGTTDYLGVNAATALQNATINAIGNNTGLNNRWGTSTVVFQSGLGSDAFTLGALTGSGNIALNEINEATLAGGNAVALTVGGNNASTTYSGVLSGAGSLIKTGTGTMTLSGANTFTGTTRVSGGTLALTSNLALQNSMLDTSGAGIVTLAPSVTTLTLGGLTGSKNPASVITGYSNLTALTLNPTAGISPSYSGAISDGSAPMTLIKSGSGTQILSGANTYTGSTTVAAGTLQFATELALYSGNAGSWTASNLIVGSGATLAFNVGGAGEFTAGDVQTLSGLGTAAAGFKSGSSIGLDTTNAGGNFTYANAIANPNAGANALGLTKLGTGALTLSATNPYTGPTNVVGGQLIVTGAITASTTIAVGSTNAVGAAVYQSGTSTVTNTSGAGGAFQIGSANGAAGYYNISGGTINVAGEIDPGGSSGGAGTFGQLDMSGGTLNLPNSTSSYLLPDRGGAGEASVVNISQGTVQIVGGATPTNNNFDGLAVGLNNVGNLTSTVTISGSGQLLTPSLTVKLNDTNFGGTPNATNVSILNLNGGTLQTLGFGTTANLASGTTNGSDYAVINLNGGTIKAGTAGNTSFLSNITHGAVNVYSGGGTIDNNGKAITIGQALLAASGMGVSSVAVGSAGSGYVAPPRVVFSGGTFTAGLAANTATGYATIDPTTGAVTGIVITNPGSYTSTSGLTVALSGPTGGTTATLGTPALNTGNASGGMTFTGTGTTTLTGISTYTGPTTIQAGTLALSSSTANNNIAPSTKLLVGDTAAHSSAVLDATAITTAGGFQIGSTQALAGFGTVKAPAAGIAIAGGAGVTAGTGGASTDTPGLLTTAGTQSWNTGGAYNWKLNLNNASTSTSGTGQTLDTAGAAGGSNWDLLSMTTLAASGPANSFAVNIVPVSGSSGNAFNASNTYQWAIADVTTGNAASLLANFQLNAANVATQTGTSASQFTLGTISDGASGQDIVVNFAPTAAPEPTSLAMLGLAAGGLMLRRRRRSASAR